MLAQVITLLVGVTVGDALLTLYVTLIMFMIDIDLVGMLWVLGLQINSITSINLVMAIGLVVDYSAHIVHNFTLQDASLSRDERVRRTMVEIGPSVLLGVTTTFLGVLPLSLASSEVFRTFFKMFMGIIVFGARGACTPCRYAFDARAPAHVPPPLPPQIH